MELKTNVQIGLLFFIVGYFISLKIRFNKKKRPGAAEKAALLHTRKTKGGLFYGSFL